MRAVAVGLVADMPLLTPRLGTEWLSQIRAALNAECWMSTADRGWSTPPQLSSPSDLLFRRPGQDQAEGP